MKLSWPEIVVTAHTPLVEVGVIEGVEEEVVVWEKTKNGGNKIK